MKQVVYMLSNSKKECAIDIPKDATEIKGDGIYLSYDLPIGNFGSRTCLDHLGYIGANVIVIDVIELA